MERRIKPMLLRYCRKYQKGTCRAKFWAIIVKNDEIISTGYSGAPRGRKTVLIWAFVEGAAEYTVVLDMNYVDLLAEANCIYLHLEGHDRQHSLPSWYRCKDW